jgi:hypothetical protein
VEIAVSRQLEDDHVDGQYASMQDGRGLLVPLAPMSFTVATEDALDIRPRNSEVQDFPAGLFEPIIIEMQDST